MSAIGGSLSIGQCVCLDAAGTQYVPATLANRTAAGRSACAGISRTPLSDSARLRAAEIQTVGPCEPEITLLGSGADNVPIIVGDSGYLERKASPTGSDIVVGKCDADGWAYLNFSTQGAQGASLTLGGSNGDVLIRASSTTATGLSPGAANNIIVSDGVEWEVQPGITVPSGSADDPVGLDGTGGLKVITIAGFTAGGDLSGSSSSQQVEAATGLTNLFTIRASAPTMQWVAATSTPRLNQADVTTNSATGQSLTVQAQNATGTSSTGGALNLTSGTGTSTAGSVAIQTGGTARFTVGPTSGTINFTNLQFSSNVTNPLFRQTDDATNSITGDTLTVQAQNATGTTTAGGNLILTSGTGTASHGLLELQVGGSPRLQLSGTAFALGDLLVGDGTKLIRRAKGSALQVLRVNAGGTDLEFATLSTSITGSDTHVLFFDGANSPAGDAGFVYDKTNDRVTVAGEIRIGSTVTNTDGLGLANNTAIYFRNAGNSLNIAALQVDSSNVVRIGDANSANVVISYESTAGFYNQDSAVYDLLVNEDTSIQARLPRLGLSMPFGTDGTGTVALGSFSEPGNTNVINADLIYGRMEITGTGGGSGGPYTLTLPTPASGGGYPKVWKNSTNLTIRIKLASGTTVDLATGEQTWLWTDTGGVERITG